MGRLYILTSPLAVMPSEDIPDFSSHDLVMVVAENVGHREIYYKGKPKLCFLRPDDYLSEAQTLLFDWLDDIRACEDGAEGAPIFSAALLRGLSVVNLTQTFSKKPSKTRALDYFMFCLAISGALEAEQIATTEVDGIQVLGSDCSLVADITSFLRGQGFSCSVLSGPSRSRFLNFAVMTLKSYGKSIILFIYLRAIFLKERMGKSKTSTKTDVALFADDIFHLYRGDDLMETTYWPGLRADLRSRHVNSAWCVLLPPWHRAPNAMQNELMESYADQSFSLRSLTDIILKSLKLQLCFWQCIKRYLKRQEEIKTTAKYPLYIMSSEFLNTLSLLPETLTFIERVDAWTARRQPELVLDRKPFNTSGKLLHLGAPKNVKIVGVQHGIVNENQLGYRFSDLELAPDIETGALSVFPDRLFVFGQRMLDVLKASPVPMNRVIVSGNYKFNKIARLRRPVGLKKKILFTSQFDGPELKSVLELIMSAIFMTDDVQLFIRTHPSMPNAAAIAEKLIKRDPRCWGRVFVDNAKSIEEALDGMSALVAHSSTTIFDAIARDVPVILIDISFAGLSNLVVTRVKGFPRFTTSEELAKILLTDDWSLDPEIIDLFNYHFDRSTSLVDAILGQLPISGHL